MSVARNTGYNLASQLIPILFSVASVPLYLHIVGLERYGVLALCWSFLGFLGFLNLGMGPAIAQKIASTRDAHPVEHARLFWTALWLNVATGIAGAFVIIVLANQYFGMTAEISGSLKEELRGALPWLSSILPVAMVGGVFGGTLIGQDRFLILNVINTLTSVLMTTLPLAAAYFFEPRLDYVIAASLLAKMLGLLLSFGACLRRMPVRRPRKPERELAGQLLTFGSWVTVTSLVAPFVVSIDQFAIGALLGPAAVALYVIPFNLVWRLSMLPASLAGALSPRFAAATPAGADMLQSEGTASLASIFMPICIVGIAGLGPFLHLWLGPVTGKSSLAVAYLFVAAAYANGIARVPHALIEARGRPDLVTKLVVAYVLPYALALYFFLQWYGLLGAAIVCLIKSICDPLALFLMAKTPWHIIRGIVWPSALVFVATIAALLVPWTSALHWAIMIILLAMAVVSAFKTMPSSLRPHLQPLFRHAEAVRRWRFSGSSR